MLGYFILCYYLLNVPYWYLISRVFNFAFFAIVKNREIKDPRIKILAAKFKHAKFNTHIENSNHR